MKIEGCEFLSVRTEKALLAAGVTEVEQLLDRRAIYALLDQKGIGATTIADVLWMVVALYQGTMRQELGRAKAEEVEWSKRIAAVEAEYPRPMAWEIESMREQVERYHKILRFVAQDLPKEEKGAV